MKRILVFVITILAVNLFSLVPQFMTEPAISPDGEKVCFAYMSDLWTVSYMGGEARRITTTKGEDWHPAYSPDGKQIAFNSNRDGWTAIYLIPAAGGKAELLNKEELRLLGWFPDGKSLLAKRDEVGKRNKFFRVLLDGNYTEISSFGGNNACISQDGKTILFDRGGMVYREAYRGSFNGDLWEYNLKADNYTRLTQTELTEQYPVYSKVLDKIYFAASDGINFQLFEGNITDLDNKKQLTDFKEFSVRNICIAEGIDRLVFEKFNELWKYDAGIGKASKLDIVINQDFLNTFEVKENIQNKVENYAISNNGKLVVFSYKYDLFAIPEKGDDVKQITFHQKGIKDIQIMNDNRTIIFTSFVDGQPRLFRVNIRDISNIEKLPWNKFIEWIKQDGNKLLIGYSDKKRQHQIAVADSLGNNIQPIISDQFVIEKAALSPDNRYVLYIETRQEVWSRHLYIYDLENNTKELLYNIDGYLDELCWGKDLKSVFFTRDKKICRLDLQAKKDFYKKEDHWKEILDPIQDFKEKKEEKTKSKNDSVRIDLEGIALRITPIISRPGTNRVVHVLNDSTFYYLNEFEKKYSLHKTDYFGDNDKKIYSFSKKPEHLNYNEKNNAFYFVFDEKLMKMNPKSKKVEIVKNKFKYEYNKLTLNNDIFDQVWVEFGRGFYDPEMHGINWKRAGKRFAKYLEHAYTPQVLKAIIYEMIGEVNASHTGYYPRTESEVTQYKTAYLGCEFDLHDLPRDGIRITKVYRKSKLNKPHGIKAGDILIAVNGKEVGKDFLSLFKDKIGESIKLGITNNDGVKVVTVKGLNYRENRNLFYDNWVEERNQMVEDATDGKVGYLHIRRMDNAAYDKFLQDLFAENTDKDALIIDVRNNGGGGITGKLIEILTKKYYAQITRRYFDSTRHYFPYKTWEKPVVLLINENSFSDAEIFPTIFKHMNLGKIIGMPTSGSVIGTGHHSFMDGSSMRMPRNGIFRYDGTNMEGSGVIPDIMVEPTPGEVRDDDDVQLKKAIEEILKEI
jgi:C-terminal processing protease CtpA/Prc/Tol biopolymer transport system component